MKLDGSTQVSCMRTVSSGAHIDKVESREELLGHLVIPSALQPPEG
jgi:hypothetical protein